MRDHATVAARSDTGHGAAIGAAAGDNGKDTEAEVTIGTAGATAEQEDVHVTATGFCGSAIGNGAKIPGHYSGPFDHPDGEHKKFHCDRK